MVMNFTVTLASGKFGNSAISPWTTMVPPLRFKRFDAEQDRDRPGARGAVERDVHALAAGDRHDACERVFRLDIDHVVGAQGFGHFHPRAVLGRAGDDDQEAPACLQITVCDRPCWPGPWISTVEL